MRLYICIDGSFAGTEADAKAKGKGFTEVDVPTDKAGLIAYLNEMVDEARGLSTNQIADLAFGPVPVPAPAAPCPVRASIKVDDDFDTLPLARQLDLAARARTKRALPAYIEDDEDPAEIAAEFARLHSAEIAAEFARLHSAATEGKQVVAVDPKRLARGGDIDHSYSAQSLMERSAVTAPFRLNGAEWANCGGLWWRGERWCDCYRLVAVEAFDGPSAPYSEHDWDAKRGSDLGGYHGMRATHGNRQLVLVGPPPSSRSRASPNRARFSEHVESRVERGRYASKQLALN